MMDQLQDLAYWLDSQIDSGRWHDKIYSYCERGGDGSFWAEPLNAWSNGAFHLAAITAFIIWLTSNASRRGLIELFLIILVFIIGTGSFLFHTLANRWSAIADVAPIGIFMLIYFAYALKRFAGFNWVMTLIGLAAFMALLWQFGQMRCGQTLCLNGSIAYLPAALVLFVIGTYLALRGHPAGGSIFSGGAIFLCSLMLRTFDKEWCARTEFGAYGTIGTHIWWHLLNALLLFILLRAAILFGHPAKRVTKVVA